MASEWRTEVETFRLRRDFPLLKAGMSVLQSGYPQRSDAVRRG